MATTLLTVLFRCDLQEMTQPNAILVVRGAAEEARVTPKGSPSPSSERARGRPERPRVDVQGDLVKRALAADLLGKGFSLWRRHVTVTTTLASSAIL